MATKCTGMKENLTPLRNFETFLQNQNQRPQKKIREGMKEMVTYAWTQKGCELCIQIQLGDQVLGEDAPKFCKNYIQIEFQDGRIWIIRLYKPIKYQTGRTRVNKTMVQLSVEKDVAESWPHLELQEASEAEEAAMEGAPKETKAGTEKEKIAEKDNAENKKNEMPTEEAVISVGNVHLQSYDQGQIRTVMFFVKNINKGSAKVSLEKDHFRLKFQTSDPNFLKDYEDATPDTFFGWSSEVMEELDPMKCKFSISNSSMQIKLARAESKQWTDSLCINKKVTPQSQSNSWISTGKGQADPSQVRVTSKPRNHTVQQPMFPRSSVSEAPSSNSAASRGQGDGAAAQVVERGMIGLYNEKENCYLNVVIQTLAHLPHFRDYFLDLFKNGLNPETAKDHKKIIASAFADCVRMLWTQKRSFQPDLLLTALGVRYDHIKSWEFDSWTNQRKWIQHDAHEVMCLVLDGLHEDLKKPESTDHLPALEDGPAEAMGQRMWEITKARDDSKIMDAVRGLYKSLVVCMTCKKESCSFDPFTSHTLPIPKRHSMIVKNVTFLWRDPSRRPAKYALQLPEKCRLSDVKAAVSCKTGVKPDRMRAFKTLKGFVTATLSEDDEVISKDPASLMVCEVLTEADAGEKVWELTVMQRRLPPGEIHKCNSCNKDRKEGGILRRCLGCKWVAYCNSSCQKNHWHKHRATCNKGVVGSPFMISLPKSKATYSSMCYFLEGCSRYSVTVTKLQSEERPGSGAVAAESGEKSTAGGRQGSISPQLTSHSSLSNLSSSSSQSSGSLNSLDSQSSGNSTSTLTADVPQEGDVDDMDSQSGAVGSSGDSMDLCYSSLGSNGSLSAHFQKSGASHFLQTEPPASLRSDGADSDCLAEDDDIEDEIGFFAKPIKQEVDPINGEERFKGKVGEPLDFSASPFIIMDWRTKYKVETRELETDFYGNQNAQDGTEQPITLEQSLLAFMDKEYLEGSNGWHCPECKKPQKAAKYLSLWKVPPVLIITLKRFHKNNWDHVTKDTTNVVFPINNLDLSSVCSREGNKDGLVYDLYAVINHLGIMNSGHFFTYIRCNEDFTPGSDPKWVYFNDQHVEPMEEKKVVSRDAYILIYRQRQPPVQAPAQPIPDGLGDGKAAEAAASVAAAVGHRERTEAWAARSQHNGLEDARPQHNGLEDGKEYVDEEVTAARGAHDDDDDDDDDDAFEDPVGSPEKWAQAVNRPPSPLEEMDDAKETMEVDDLDAGYESNVNNSCPEPDRAQVEDEPYTDMDSLD